MKKITQKDVDKLLTPIMVKLHPKCLLCGAETQVVHHHCHKSKSLNLRYDLKNLIPLCSRCHLRLHFDESFWGSKVRDIKGKKWFAYIERQKNIILKYIDYDKVYKKLSRLLAKLEKL